MGRLLFNSVLAAIGAAAIAAPTLMVTSYQPIVGAPMAREFGGEFLPTPPAYELARLRKLAEAGCRCARVSNDKKGADDCWQAFDEAAKTGFRSHTACIPLSEQSISFDDSSERVTLSYTIVGGQSASGADFCTLEEARAAEALAASIGNGSGSETDQNAAFGRSIEAMKSLSKQFARGKQVAHAEPGYGCSGG